MLCFMFIAVFSLCQVFSAIVFLSAVVILQLGKFTFSFHHDRWHLSPIRHSCPLAERFAFFTPLSTETADCSCRPSCGIAARFRHGWSLLSVRRHRKRTVDLLGCPDGSIKFSWGYPLKELRSSAPLFISSWIMVAKSFFTLSLSVFAPAFSTYTVLSPNLKVA